MENQKEYTEIGMIHGMSAEKMANILSGLHLLSMAFTCTGAFFVIPQWFGELPFFLRLPLAVMIAYYVERIVMGFLPGWSLQLSWNKFTEKGSRKLFIIATFMLFGAMGLNFLISNEGRKSAVDRLFAITERPSTDSLHAIKIEAINLAQKEYDVEVASIDAMYDQVNDAGEALKESLIAQQERKYQKHLNLYNEDPEQYGWARGHYKEALDSIATLNTSFAGGGISKAEGKLAALELANATKRAKIDEAKEMFESEKSYMLAQWEEQVSKDLSKKSGWDWVLWALVMITSGGILLLRLYSDLYIRYSGQPMPGETYVKKQRSKRLFSAVSGFLSDKVEQMIYNIEASRTPASKDRAQALRLPGRFQMMFVVALMISIGAGYALYIVEDTAIRTGAVGWFVLVVGFAILSQFAKGRWTSFQTSRGSISSTIVNRASGASKGSIYEKHGDGTTKSETPMEKELSAIELNDLLTRKPSDIVVPKRLNWDDKNYANLIRNLHGWQERRSTAAKESTRTKNAEKADWTMEYLRMKGIVVTEENGKIKLG